MNRRPASRSAPDPRARPERPPTGRRTIGIILVVGAALRLAAVLWLADTVPYTDYAAETPLYSHRLSMIGFWSLAFVYVWTGAHHMLHGPISQWLQTVAILFSIMLMIPVWTLVWNFLATMKGQWHQLKDNVPIKFLMTGTIFYLLTCFQGPMHSLRTVNAVVSKTDWIVGHAHMAVLGAFSFFAVGAAYYAIPRMLRTRRRAPAASGPSSGPRRAAGRGSRPRPAARSC